MSNQNKTSTGEDNMAQKSLPNFNAKASAYSIGLLIMVCMNALAFLQTGRPEPAYLVGSVLMLSLTGGEMLTDWKNHKEKNLTSQL